MKNQLGQKFINELYAGVATGAVCITLLPQKQSIWLDASDKEKSMMFFKNTKIPTSI